MTVYLLAQTNAQARRYIADEELDDLADVVVVGGADTFRGRQIVDGDKVVTLPGFSQRHDAGEIRATMSTAWRLGPSNPIQPLEWGPLDEIRGRQ